MARRALGPGDLADASSCGAVPAGPPGARCGAPSFGSRSTPRGEGSRAACGTQGGGFVWRARAGAAAVLLVGNKDPPMPLRGAVLAEDGAGSSLRGPETTLDAADR